MSDQETVDTPQSELEALKARADLLSISYHPSIGVDKLREKVNAAINGSPKEDDTKKPDDSAQTTRQNLRKEALKLVRIRVTCMNPAKSEWDGEIFTVGNSVVGSVKKYVPFNNDEGWHVPYIMYEMLKDRECQIFKSVKKNGIKVQEGYLIREFGIEVLPPLTDEELQELARRQALGRNID